MSMWLWSVKLQLLITAPNYCSVNKKKLPQFSGVDARGRETNSGGGDFTKKVKFLFGSEG